VHGAVSRELPKQFGECASCAQQEGHKNCRDCLVQSSPNSFKITLSDGALLVCLGQRCAGIDEIDTIFQGPRSRRSSMGTTAATARHVGAIELARCECRTVDRIGESLSLLIAL